MKIYLVCGGRGMKNNGYRILFKRVKLGGNLNFLLFWGRRFL